MPILPPAIEELIVEAAALERKQHRIYSNDNMVPYDSDQVCTCVPVYPNVKNLYFCATEYVPLIITFP